MDRVVENVNALLRRRGYKAYSLALNTGAVLATILAIVIGFRELGASGWRLPVVAVATFYYPIYPLGLAVKKVFVGTAARSFLFDSVLFLLPCYFGLSWLTGITMYIAAGYIGIALPLILAIMRIGCFFDGCCYGPPSRWGVRYTADGTRVFPLQLVDAAVNGALFVTLSSVAVVGSLNATLLAWYLLGYGSFRVVSEFFRGHHNRPRRGPLWESQWIAAAVVVGAGIWLWL